MADYKEMYLSLFNATEEAINLLIAAQRKCEQMYVTGEDAKVTLLPNKDEAAP